MSRSRRRWLSSLVLPRVRPRGGAGSHYSWNGSRVNTRQSAIGHCTDLQQETKQGWGREARSGTGKKDKKKGIWGENSCAVVEVGINNDAEH